MQLLNGHVPRAQHFEGDGNGFPPVSDPPHLSQQRRVRYHCLLHEQRQHRRPRTVTTAQRRLIKTFPRANTRLEGQL